MMCLDEQKRCGRHVRGPTSLISSKATTKRQEDTGWAAGSTRIQSGLSLPIFSYDLWRRKDVNDDSCSHFIGLMGLSLLFFCPLTPLLHFSPFRISSWVICVHDFPEGTIILARTKEDKTPTEEGLI